MIYSSVYQKFKFAGDLSLSLSLDKLENYNFETIF